ncbi:hypothetical protein CH253_15845 [Rhodococcus sp. 06-156-3C]|nr:hypothetical protein CH253_15845 [Rhodococcus sp. 06-156-3C]OZD21656.1 hypothetical protein CH280_01760 [Rhodococcus sp. 06-156-4C]OZD25341.1 hypothetical protein CH248_04630 [Rhodococcus sp. 06-156-4a]OZD33044.1 hypothetical protein CH247_10230 [Rhodococcus sp. 06-156-3b]OZD41880.1 hypothetical protein CH284_00450 [Rhodococcus sp. 06-156-3]OZF60249.1 hypothetical protein CH290_17875 [Rhodococcus sp. 06-156-4]
MLCLVGAFRIRLHRGYSSCPRTPGTSNRRPGHFLNDHGLVIARELRLALIDTPFSAGGAAVVASAQDEQRELMSKALIGWGLSTIVVGPIMTIGALMATGQL